MKTPINAPDTTADGVVGAIPHADAAQMGKSVVVSYLGLLSAILAAVALTPFLARSLGTERYGTWILVGSVVSYLGLLDMGLRFGVTRYTARLDTLTDAKSVGAMLSSAFTAYFSLAILALLVTFGLVWSVPVWFHVQAASLGIVRAVVLLLGVNACLSLPLTLLTGMLRGYQRFTYLSWIDVALNVLNAILTVLIIEVGGGLIALGAVTLLVSGVRCLVLWAYVRVHFPNVQISWRSPLRTHELLKFGGAAAVIMASGQIVFASDAIVVGAIISVPAVGIYGVTQRLVDGVAAIAYQGIDVLFPYMTRLDAQAQIGRLRQWYVDAVAVSLAIVAPCTICVVAFGRAILDAWAGPTYSAGFPVLVALFFALLVHMPGHVSAIVLLSMNRHRVLAMIAVFDAIGNLTLSVILGHVVGLVGVALGTTVMLTVTSFILIPIYTGHVLALHPLPYVGRGILPVLLASIIPSFAAFAMRYFFQRPSLGILVADLLVTLAVAALSTWFVVLTRSQRAIVWSLVGHFLKVTKRRDRLCDEGAVPGRA